MLAVAIIAIVLGAGIESIRLERARNHFVRKASEHAAWEKQCVRENGKTRR